MTHTDERKFRIRRLNDEFRRSMSGGIITVTPGIQAMPLEQQLGLIFDIRAHDEFDEDNDPYGEHDFGVLEKNGQRAYFKIDYYNRELTGHSADPADPAQTTRAMTIMLAHEY